MANTGTFKQIFDMIKKNISNWENTHTKETIQVYDRVQQFKLHEAFPANERENKAKETGIKGLVFDISKIVP